MICELMPFPSGPRPFESKIIVRKLKTAERILLKKVFVIS